MTTAKVTLYESILKTDNLVKMFLFVLYLKGVFPIFIKQSEIAYFVLISMTNSMWKSEIHYLRQNISWYQSKRIYNTEMSNIWKVCTFTVVVTVVTWVLTLTLFQCGLIVQHLILLKTRIWFISLNWWIVFNLHRAKTICMLKSIHSFLYVLISGAEGSTES